MIEEFKVGEKRYGLIKGKQQSIVCVPDCQHVVVDNDEPLTLGDAYSADTEQTVSIGSLDTAPVDVAQWVHYFGVKPRVRGNYFELIESIRQIGLDPGAMPVWADC
jgi:hypothetical protein